MNEDLDKVSVVPQGLIDNGIYGYEMKSSKSRLSYGYEPASNTLYLYSIATPVFQDKNKGYAKELLESFFQLIKQYNGALDSGTYTTSGMVYIKHVVERFSKKYGVKLVKGQTSHDRP